MGGLLTLVYSSYLVALLVDYRLFYVIAGVFGALFMVSAVGLGRPLSLSPRHWPMACFFALTFVSAAWSAEPAHTFRHASLGAVNGLCYFIVALDLARGRDRALTRLPMVLPVVTLGLSGLLLFRFGSVRSVSAQMAVDVAAFSNHAVAVVELCWPICVALAIAHPRAWLPRIGAGSAICVILISGSRAGLLLLVAGVLAAMAMFAGLRARRRGGVLAGVATALMIAVGLVAALGGEATIGPAVERVAATELRAAFVPAAGYNPGANVRSRALAGQVAIIESAPMLGIGYRGTRSYNEASLGISVVAHNVYMQLWGELGIPGVLVGVWALIAAFGGIRRARRCPPGIAADRVLATGVMLALLIALVHAVARPQLDNPAFYWLLAVACSVPRLGEAARRVEMDEVRS